MKKLLLLMTVGLVAGGANAQEARNLSIVRTGVSYQAKSTELEPYIIKSNQKIADYKAARAAATATSANKGTAGNARVYNWSDYLKNVRSMTTSSPYMWFNGDGMAIYSNTTGGFEVDTIQLASYGMAIAPWYTEWNDAGVPGYLGKIALNQQSPYQVDSLVTYGFYGRNPNKPNVVDTLIFALTYGAGGANSSIQTVYYTGIAGTDTLRCLDMAWNQITHTADTVGTGASVTKYYLYLTVADSSSSRFAVPVNRTIPAGNAVGATITFKSGDAAFVPYTDTVFAGPTTPDRPFKFGMLRPAMYEETTGQSPLYTKGNQNTGQIKFLPERNTSYAKDYVPTWAYTAPFTLEWADIDFVISSSNPFSTVGVKNVGNIISGVNVYPNPASSEVRVNFNLNTTANTNVSIKNMVGQVIATQNMGTVANGVATFNTSALTNGVYFCTVESNGQQTTNRFVVAH